MMQITIRVCGEDFQCTLDQLAYKAKELRLEASGFARNLRIVRQALKEGRSGRINSADGYQISYQN